MLAISCVAQSDTAPLSGLRVSDVECPPVPDGWVEVALRAVSLNHHDLWSLRGVGLDADRLPMILGCDGAGVLDDGTEVVVHAVIGDPAAGGGDESLDPRRSLLSEVHPGTLAERVAVPARNVVPKPASISWEEAACLPTAWLTAYRMLTTRSGLTGPGTVLVQGTGGGVSSAAITLGRALGHTVFCTSRDPEKRRRALDLGADFAVAPGERLPWRADVVIESVGAQTWAHSLKCLVPGGRVVVCGATSGTEPPSDLARMFFLQLSVVGSTMGTRHELEELLALLDRTGERPVIDRVHTLADGATAFARLLSGAGFGKQVLTVP